MDNRDQIDVPQALQWPAKLGGYSRRVCPVFVQPENSKGLNMFHLNGSCVLREPLESRHECELKRKETGPRAGGGTSLYSPRAPWERNTWRLRDFVASLSWPHHRRPHNRGAGSPVHAIKENERKLIPQPRTYLHTLGHVTFLHTCWMSVTVCLSMSDGFLFSGIQHGAKFRCPFGFDRWLLPNRKQEIKQSTNHTKHVVALEIYVIIYIFFLVRSNFFIFF